MVDQRSQAPGYMAQLLEELGWNQGTRIPLANPGNQELESLLISRQNEIQRLKEALKAQQQKRDDLNKYKDHVHTEYQENTRLLFAHKQQLEQEVKLKQLSCNEADRLDRDVQDCGKESSTLTTRVDRLQTSIARLLKKADSLKSEVCGERGALQEWRAALDRSANDITAIEQFTKQDLSKAKELEIKRQKLKVEHDRMIDRLNQLVSNLSAEERACERISVQVMEGMEQRKQMMTMWTSAVENLRQRDIDIRHIREDYAVLEAEANATAEQCREQQAFCEQQRGNNADAQRENMTLAQQLSNTRAQHQDTLEQNLTLDSEVQSLQRESSNIQNEREALHMENRRILEKQRRSDDALQVLNNKIRELKSKLAESTDKSKSSEKRAKELEDMLNEEERYATQVTTSQQRAMHCSFVEQQKLNALLNEEKLFHMQLKASKAIMSKLDSKQREVQRNLQSQKESLYSICYQVETIGARVSHMEGAQAERECSAELLERENRLKDVCARHAARVALLERHSSRLHDDMRRLTRDLESRNAEHVNLQSRLKTSMLNVEGGEKQLQQAREAWRRARVEEALLRLRAAHAARALAGLDDTAYTLDTQRLQLDAAMNERLVEIAARRDMFGVQKRALLHDCGDLRAMIREREQRVEQLVKRHDIFIASLGKDDAGQQLSVTFFKIKFAAERAELRERGAALDAEIARRERDVAAMEATLRLTHFAHAHFMAHISPLSDNAPEIQELNGLSRQYYEKRDELKDIQSRIVTLEQVVADATSRLVMLNDKCKQLSAREADTEQELESSRERLLRQESRLQNALDVVRTNARRAKKLIDGVDDWRIFQMCVWIRDYGEAAESALQGLGEASACGGRVASRLAAALAAADLERHLAPHQRRLHHALARVISGSSSAQIRESHGERDDAVFSSSSESVRSGVSVASGYTKRLSAFRKTLATKVQESASVPDFWNLEILGIQDPVLIRSKQEKEEEVLKSFEDTVRRNEENRYEVQLPWKAGHDDLLDNREIAFRRLESATNKLKTCGKLQSYNNILQEWEHAGIIEPVPVTSYNKSNVHYLPHRAVSKENSLTTKLRPVYDASAKDKNGKSLNACLEKGINFIDKIPDLLIGFRKGVIGISADIAKAFLQISIHPDDRDHLRFLWWKDPETREIMEYRHCRVVFGLTSSPFLLSATIQHHLEQIKGKYKNTVNILSNSFYVDNLITSLDTEEMSLKFIKEAKDIMQEAKFDLRQWVTSPLKINETKERVISVLGIMWDTVTDELFCSLQVLPHSSEIGKLTKRNILSLTQKIFDPIGILCPIALVPRLILQEIWNKNITWDEELPPNIKSKFHEWYDNVHLLENCRIPRHLSTEPLQSCLEKSLHLFCDASKDGYAACTFLRTEDSKGNVTVRLISAKSRISTPEKITIPRLELLAALIGSRLIKGAREKLNLNNCKEYYWCDSGVTLCWIKRQLIWNNYVGNRVKEIRQNTNINDWHHIPGSDNWADLPSRGCNSRQLLETRWWEGPPWLCQPEELWPRSALVVDEKEACKELKKSVCVNTCCDNGMTQELLYFSKYSKIIRMTAWMLRFIYNSHSKEEKKKGEISFEEYEAAEKKVIKIIQAESKEYIQKHIEKLTTFYDKDNILRIKTKLILTDFPEDVKTPAVLPAANVITRRLVEQRHTQLLHAGTNMMITDLRKRFWIIGIRKLVKSVIDKCMICRRHRAKATQVSTAPLPVDRIQPLAPFEVTGVDLAGPIYLRGDIKSWIVIYTCAVYRAIHLELTQSLSTDAFIRTFRRFIARRGRPNIMISDNGTNFTGTKNALNNLDWDEIQRVSSIIPIKWKLNAPTAAWWGGFFERMIKIVKNILRRVLGTSSVTYEEMETLLCDCESVVNDRPLTYVEADDSSALEPLRPSCFLQCLPTSQLIEDIPEQARRSTVSLRVVTLGLEQSMPAVTSSISTKSRKSFR